MNYGAAGDLLGKAATVGHGIEHTTESVEEQIVESTPIDVGNIPAVPNVANKAAEIGSKAKAVADGAKAKVAEHVEKAKDALEAAGVSAMLVAIYATLTAKRFHGFHVVLAVVITIIVMVILNSLFSPSYTSTPVGDGDGMQLTSPSSALMKQHPVSVAMFVPSGNAARTFHA